MLIAAPVVHAHHAAPPLAGLPSPALARLGVSRAGARSAYVDSAPMASASGQPHDVSPAAPSPAVFRSDKPALAVYADAAPRPAVV